MFMTIQFYQSVQVFLDLASLESHTAFFSQPLKFTSGWLKEGFSRFAKKSEDDLDSNKEDICKELSKLTSPLVIITHGR